ncbi:MAG: patatin-like phospholipase family protein [Christensenellaceae bacterium]|jgi:NTE family protein|nr:patatin-like phospholipase family protein [Christensenellaceae bacterium]
MLGLVLEGGGAKGAFHIGALKALFENSYKFDAVMGASIGAFNGAVVAQGDFDICYDLWNNLTPSMLADVDDEKYTNIVHKRWDKDTVKYLFGILRRTIANRGLPTDKMRAFFSQYINEEKLRASSMDFGIVTVSMTDDWLPIEIFKDQMPPGTILDYIFASASFPAFKKEEIAGKRYMDGGIYDNLPLNPLIRKGYQNIIAIRTMSNMPRQKVIDMSVKIDYICPSEPLGKTLSFTQERLRRNLKMGYFDALRFIKNYAGVLYYLEPMSDAEFTNYVNVSGILPFKKVSTLFDLPVREDASDTISALSKKLKDLGIVATSSFNTFLSFLEPFAQALGVDRFEVYTAEHFLKKLLEKYIITGREVLDEKIKLKPELKNLFHVIVNTIITHGDLI